MPSTVEQYFDIVEVYDGSSFTDRTLESQSPAGTAFAILEGTDDFLYLGDASKFDMALFDIATAGSLGTLKYEYWNGSAFTEFIPMSGTYQNDPDDNESTVSNRLKTYDEQTLPILDHYRSKGIVKDVDAMQSINDVTSQIEAIISDL